MEVSGWVGAGVPSVVERPGPGVRCPTPFFAPLGLMFCPERGLSEPCLGESTFSVPLFLHALWTVLPFPSPPLPVPFPVPFPHLLPLSFTSASTNPPEWVGIQPLLVSPKDRRSGPGPVGPSDVGAGGGLCRPEGCPGSDPGQTRCEELWAPGREDETQRLGRGCRPGEQL